eukprot:6540165-Alexandrium_andersonii.AAC.1
MAGGPHPGRRCGRGREVGADWRRRTDGAGASIFGPAKTEDAAEARGDVIEPARERGRAKTREPPTLRMNEEEHCPGLPGGLVEPEQRHLQKS